MSKEPPVCDESIQDGGYCDPYFECGCADDVEDVPAPEKIYLQLAADNETTWCVDRIEEKDVEYVRADLVTHQVEAARRLAGFGAA